MAPRRTTDETRRISPPVRRPGHRADPPRHRALAEALGAGRARAPRERRHRTLLLGREQPAPCRRPAGARLRRRALGHLPPDPGPRRPSQKRRARHPDPLIPGPPEDCRQRRARPARQGQRRQARLPPRADAHARRPAVHRVQRRAGRRTAGPAYARCRAALEGPPAGRDASSRTAGSPSVTWRETARSTT